MPNYRASVGHPPFIHVKRANPVNLAGQAVGLTLGSSWQLASGHFIPAKMPMQIIHPRPDVERATEERCGRVPSGIGVRIPVSVQGGARPLKYELTTKPSWATIGETIPSDWIQNGLQDYGVITGTPTVGVHNFTARVTDQGGATATVSWTMNCIDRENTTYFLFVNAASPAGGNGSYSSPFNEIADWYLGSRTDSTYDGRQVFYYTGTYTFPAVALQANATFDFKNQKPWVHVAIPGETPTFDLESLGMMDFNGGTLAGICLSGLRIINFRHLSGGIPRKSALRMAGHSERSVFFENLFDGGGAISSQDGSNSAPIMYKDMLGSTRHTYCVVSNNEFYRCTDTDTVLCYDTMNLVYEGNRITGGMTLVQNGGWGIYLKGSATLLQQENYTIAFNVGLEPPITRPICRVDASGQPHNVEVCWNMWKSTNQYSPPNQGHYGNGYISIGNWNPNSATAYYGNIYCYRNSAKIPHESPWNVSTGTFLFENDAWQHDGLITDGWSPQNCGTMITDASVRQNMLVASSGLFDATTNLLTPAYSANRGTHGCEVA